jgi:hypothetical protein
MDPGEDELEDDGDDSGADGVHVVGGQAHEHPNKEQEQEFGEDHLKSGTPPPCCRCQTLGLETPWSSPMLACCSPALLRRFWNVEQRRLPGI